MLKSVCLSNFWTMRPILFRWFFRLDQDMRAAPPPAGSQGPIVGNPRFNHRFNHQHGDLVPRMQQTQLMQLTQLTTEEIVLFLYILYHFASFCIILYHFVSYCIILHHFVSFCIILYHFASFCIILHHFVSFCIILYHLYRFVSFCCKLYVCFLLCRSLCCMCFICCRFEPQFTVCVIVYP